MTIAERWEAVETRLAKTLQQTGRKRQDITLLAVTKVFPVEILCEAYRLGLREFGENYVQEFETKHPTAASLPEARFHLIGHLQSNKSRRAAEIFHVVQTVDSPKLARRLDEAAASALDVMIEVKLSVEEAKAGCAPQDLSELLDTIRALPKLRLKGLMTMPPWNEDAEATRPYFRRLRELAVRHGVEGLSMGMSHDFEVAVEEGSTCIRVGTALFGRRIKVP